MADNLVAPALSHSNWVIRLHDGELMLKYRSFHSRKLKESDPQIIVLSPGEISCARLMHLEIRLPNQAGDLVQTRSTLLLSLLLRSESLALDQALREEFHVSHRLAAEPASSFLQRPVFLASSTTLMVRIDKLLPDPKDLPTRLGYPDASPATRVLDSIGPIDRAGIKKLVEAGERKAPAQLALARGGQVWEIVREVEDEI
jgi:hypothetical protein